jgi:hypothetical protein
MASAVSTPSVIPSSLPGVNRRIAAALMVSTGGMTFLRGSRWSAS